MQIDCGMISANLFDAKKSVNGADLFLEGERGMPVLNVIQPWLGIWTGERGKDRTVGIKMQENYAMQNRTNKWLEKHT